MSDCAPLARTDGLLTETIDGELLVYDLEVDVVSRLNHTATLIWRSCDGLRTIAQLVAIVVEELGERAEEDVVLIGLDLLSESGLIVSGYEERDGAAFALSHRRLCDRVGAGAAEAVAPKVFRMVAPTAATAG